MSDFRKHVSACEVKQAPGDDPRVLRFIGSDQTPDRDDDIIDADGWELDEYTKNPVFLWAHNYNQLPLGKAVQVFIDPERKALVFDIRFPTIGELCPNGQASEDSLFIETVFNMYQQGILSAVSVGFRPVAYEQRSDGDQAEMPMWQRGMHIMKAKLFELSAVPIPANPNALMTPKGFKSFIAKGLELINKKPKEVKTVSTQQKAGAKFSAETIEKLKGLQSHVQDIQEHAQGVITKCEAWHKAFEDIGIPKNDNNGDSGVQDDGGEPVGGGASADAGDSAAGVGTGGSNNTGNSDQDGGASDGREEPNKPNKREINLSNLDFKAVEASLPKLGKRS